VSVVVIGDANVDMEIALPSGGQTETHGNPAPRLFGGGSAANTAAALARLGVDCSFVGTVGDDSYGRYAVASLVEAGVDTSSIETTRNTPTVMVVVIVPPGGERLIYVWPPNGGAHAELSVASAESSTVGAEWLHVSALCLRVSPAREAILAAMRAARASKIPVSFDLNLRLENWGWDDGFRAVVEEAVTLSDVVMGAAMDEVVPLTGLEDPISAARALAGDDRLVIARLGADGAVACSGERTVTHPGFAVDVADTVGAGDAFNAGFIATRHQGAGVAEAMAWGNAVAALTVARSGARSTPTRDEVEAILAV
jgi:sugar/nucleoside kinase (ribokinase family)